MINMSETNVAALREEAKVLLRQLPDEKLALFVKLLHILVELTNPADGVPRRRREAGIAAGKFVVPDDIDADNELIADLFEGRGAP